jgi:hypothetical protein
MSTDLISACVELTDFLNVHLGPGNWRQLGAGRQEGSPFEIAIAAALEPPFVDEVMIGVKALNGQIDLDVIVRLGNQFGIIEAKAGNNGGQLDGIKQLSNAGRHLGTYTQQLYVITVEPNTAHQAIVEASRFQVVSLPEYRLGEQGLTANDSQRIIEAVKMALQG